MNLEEERKKIDRIDEQLVDLLNTRFEICTAIGAYKKANNLPIYNGSREDEIIKRLSELEEYKGMVQHLWPLIMEFSRSLQ